MYTMQIPKLVNKQVKESGGFQSVLKQPMLKTTKKEHEHNSGTGTADNVELSDFCLYYIITAPHCYNFFFLSNFSYSHSFSLPFILLHYPTLPMFHILMEAEELKHPDLTQYTLKI